MSISGNWDRRVSRKAFLGIGGLSAAALLLGSGSASAEAGCGPLVDHVLGKSAAPGTTGAGMAADASLVCRSELGGK